MEPQPAAPASPALGRSFGDYRRGQQPSPGSPLTQSIDAKEPSSPQKLAVRIEEELNPARRIEELEAENRRVIEENARLRKENETYSAFFESQDSIATTLAALHATADEKLGEIRVTIKTRLDSPQPLEYDLAKDLAITTTYEQAILETKQILDKTTATLKGKASIITDLQTTSNSIAKLLTSLGMEVKRWSLLYYTPLAIKQFDKQVTALNAKLVPFIANPHSCTPAQLADFNLELEKVNTVLKELLAPEKSSDPTATQSALFKFFSYGQDKAFQETLSEDFKIKWSRTSSVSLEMFVKAYEGSKIAEREIDIISKELTIGKRLKDLEAIHVEIRPRIRTAKSVFKTDKNQTALKEKAELEFATYTALVNNWGSTIIAYLARLRQIDNTVQSKLTPVEWKKEIKILPKFVREAFTTPIQNLLEARKTRLQDHRKNLEDVHDQFNTLYLWFTGVKVDWLRAGAKFNGFSRFRIVFYPTRLGWSYWHKDYTAAESLYFTALGMLNGYKPPVPINDPLWSKAKDIKEENSPSPQPQVAKEGQQ